MNFTMYFKGKFMDKQLTADGTILTILVGNKFDYGQVEAFREAYAGVDDKIRHIVVDLAKTEYMDSSALGMLLNMQQALNDRPIRYEISNCQPQIARILKISRFDKKFEIR